MLFRQMLLMLATMIILVTTGTKSVVIHGSIETYTFSQLDGAVCVLSNRKQLDYVSEGAYVGSSSTLPPASKFGSYYFPNKSCELREAIGKTVVDIGPGNGCRYDFYYDFIAIELVSYTPYWIAFCSREKLISVSKRIGTVVSHLSGRHTWESCRRKCRLVQGECDIPRFADALPLQPIPSGSELVAPRKPTSLYFTADRNSSVIVTVYGWQVPDCPVSQAIQLTAFLGIITCLLTIL